MLKVKYENLYDIVDGRKIEYVDGDISNKLINKDILNIDDIPFDDFILKYADDTNMPLLYNGYQYDSGFKSGNDRAIREYTLYPNTIFLPLSDGLLGLISNFIDEYDSYESPTFIARSYEVFKIISDEMKGKAIIVFDME